MTDKKQETGCGCGAAPALVFACSGAADVGEIADAAARELSADGIAKMFCLAGIGGRIPGIMATAQAAERILAIDGCPLDCARKSLETAGFEGFEHVQLAELGMEKGKSLATAERVATVIRRGKELLDACDNLKGGVQI